MYDRLGELLKNSLERGTLDSIAENLDEKRAVSDGTDAASENDAPLHHVGLFAADGGAGRENDTVKIINFTHEKKEELLRFLTKKSQPAQGEVIRAESGAAKKARRLVPMPKNVAAAYRLLGVAADAETAEIREAYRVRLKMFHPDAHGENETVQKVAHQKTEETVEAYKLISAWKARSTN